MKSDKQSKNPVGRPSKYTPELANEICKLLATGLSLRKISQIDGMPEPLTVRKWTRENEDFLIQYTQAREEQAESYAEQIIDEAFSANDAQLGRLRMDALRWTASKLLPKKYGDRIEHEVNQRTQINYTFAIPDRALETITLETGANPPSLTAPND